MPEPMMKTTTPHAMPPPRENRAGAPVAKEMMIHNSAAIAPESRLLPKIVRIRSTTSQMRQAHSAETTG
jgi:hypothetical protein